MTSSLVRRCGVGFIAGATAVGGATALWAGVAGAASASPTIGFSAVKTPTAIAPATTGQKVADESFTLPSDFATGETVTLDVAPHTTTTETCLPATGTWLTFAGTPKATVSGGPSGATPPTVAVSVGSATTTSTCATAEDQLTLTITGTPSTSSTTAWTVTLSTLEYSTMVKTPAGTVALTASATSSGSAVTVTPAPSPNATVAYPVAKPGSPAVTLAPSTDVQAVPDVVLTEGAPDTFEQASTVTISLTGATFDATAPIKATATGGGAAVTGTKVSLTTGDSKAGFAVKTASTGAPATYTVSGIAVDTTTAVGKVVATVAAGGEAKASTPVTHAMPISGAAQVLGAVVQSTRVEGQTADDTAAAEFAKAFPVTPTDTSTGNRTAVLATDEDYQDALSAAYLAGQLGTGVLLTPTASVSSVTLTALRTEGVEKVYVVGGTFAVSAADVKTLESTPSYKAGGTVARGASTTLTVTRIAGATADDTSQDVAQKFPATAVGTMSVRGAYTGTYNDTTAADGTQRNDVPTTDLPTAVLARDSGYQDATSASALAYHTHLPILLTPTSSLSTAASGAIENLGIRQVIVMGGTLAITNGVVSKLESLGVDVFRVAGHDATDTSQQLATFELSSTKTAGRDWDASGGVYVARGDFYSDAIAGSADAARSESPIVMTENTTTLGKYVTGFLTKVGAGQFSSMATTSDFELVVLGGPLAVTLQAVSQAENAITAGAAGS